MAPIRVGILGLSVSTGGTSWAKNAHLEYLKASPKYELIAICNSSAESAQKAIKEFGLGPDAKAYGSPEDLAKDPHVDLVVCSTRVDRHYEGIMPAIKAGKDVFCEWPLCANRKQAEEVTKLAKEKGIRTMVGLQAQVSPFVNKVKDLIAQGKIGDVLSSTWIGSPGNGGEEEGTGVAYFTDREVGGNMLTIQFAHCEFHENI